MIEIDSSIISAETLLERVRRSVLNKKIEPLQMERTLTTLNKGALNINIDLLNKEMNSLAENVRALDRSWQIHDSEITTGRKSFAGLNIFIKKAIRRLTYWVLIRPYWDQQVAFNGAATRAISDVMKTQEMIITSVLDNKE